MTEGEDHCDVKMKDNELFWEYEFAVDKKIFSDWDAFSKGRWTEFEKINPENAEPLHILSAALSRQSSMSPCMPSSIVVFLHYMGIFVWYVLI